MNGKPKVSILTSFDVDHFGDLKNTWPHSLFPYVEVYAFMHNCLDPLFGPASSQESALRILAKARKDPNEPSRVAEKIHQHFDKMQVAAITTFLPEISAPKNFDAWRAARQALEFLVLTLFELQRTYKHPCRTLVLVGGSRFDGMWLGEDLVGDKVYVVNRLKMDEAIRRLLERLEPVANLAADKGVSLALSMEPGPLFTVDDWDSLVSFCDMLEAKGGALSRNVGLNLDLAHWAFLSNITTKMVRGQPNVLKRILHAHVADHDRGHCSDAVPTTFHSAAEFLPWFKLLADLSARPPDPNAAGLRYSGFVSCELESAHDLQTVESAAQIMQGWVDSC